MTTKWSLKIMHGTIPYFYGPYTQKRAEELAIKMNVHFKGNRILKIALAAPMLDPGITWLRRNHQ